MSLRDVVGQTSCNLKMILIAVEIVMNNYVDTKVFFSKYNYNEAQSGI